MQRCRDVWWQRYRPTRTCQSWHSDNYRPNKQELRINPWFTWKSTRKNKTKNMDNKLLMHFLWKISLSCSLKRYALLWFFSMRYIPRPFAIRNSFSAPENVLKYPRFEHNTDLRLLFRTRELWNFDKKEFQSSTCQIHIPNSLNKIFDLIKSEKKSLRKMLNVSKSINA